MKILRLLLGAVLLAAACDTHDPVTPPPAPRYDTGEPGPASAPCDSACEAQRSPMLGGSNG